VKEVPFAVADPDLQIREGPGHPDPGEGGLSPKKIFSALRASVWSNNKGGGAGPPAPPLDLPLLLSIEGIRKGYLFCQKWYIKR